MDQRTIDLRWLRLAREKSTWSKDPSTKVGAYIVRPDNTEVSSGYNGFPRKLEDRAEDLNDRDVKYRKTIHGEMNAMHFARESIEGCTLYTYPFQSCHNCTPHVIQRGITRVVAPRMSEDIASRWSDSVRWSMEMFEEAGVEVVLYDIEELDEL